MLHANWVYHACRLGILGVGTECHSCMLEGEFDASSSCLEGPLSVIIEVVEFQAAGCGVQGKFKCSSGDDTGKKFKIEQRT